MKLFLVAALCALLAVQVTSRIPLPPDSFGVDTTDLTSDAAVNALYARWAKKQKNAPPVTDANALANFRASASKVKANRAAVAAGTSNMALALNMHAHMSFADFTRKRLGRKSSDGKKAAHRKVRSLTRSKRAGPAVDWNAQGYVTSVKDQGQCGCCWAFSAAGAIEGAYYKAKKQLISFSAQEFMECVTLWAGCGGGWEYDAFNYVQQIGGLDTDASYPYTAGDGTTFSTTCQSKAAPSRIPMTLNWQQLDTDDASLLNAVQTIGPIAVTISVGDNFMLYSSGVIDSTATGTCNTTVNHAVLLTGAGTDSVTGKDYWQVKNSWSADWGETGFFRMDRANSNACLINTYAYSATVS